MGSESPTGTCRPFLLLEAPTLGDCDPAFNDGSCCTSDSPCGLGEGDCDSDSDCAGDLTCGNDNCDPTYGAESWLDCCVGRQGLIDVYSCPPHVKYFISKQKPRSGSFVSPNANYSQ